MKRALLGLAVAAAAVFTAAPAQAASYCGDTFQPPCEVCYQPDWTFGPICVSIDLGPTGS